MTNSLNAKLVTASFYLIIMLIIINLFMDIYIKKMAGAIVKIMLLFA